ncbi:hypothetical protein WMY93_012134 [Mugilogobius chulae]|uniref:Secreted protein n=1 Tax=Mugilogobius chulae TaxID=88201 RepID=A0AAW0PGQ9_9GOBI
MLIVFLWVFCGGGVYWCGRGRMSNPASDYSDCLHTKRRGSLDATAKLDEKIIRKSDTIWSYIDVRHLESHTTPSHHMHPSMDPAEQIYWQKSPNQELLSSPAVHIPQLTLSCALDCTYLFFWPSTGH